MQIRFFVLLLHHKTQNMAPDNRKKHVVSYENMSPKLVAAFNEKYPRGFNDYLDDLVKYPKPDGTSFYAVTLEFPEDLYLVKIKVKIDDMEDIERWLEGEEEAETEQVAGTAPDNSSSSDSLPDDNISQYGSDEESQESI